MFLQFACSYVSLILSQYNWCCDSYSTQRWSAAIVKKSVNFPFLNSEQALLHPEVKSRKLRQYC